MADRNSTPSTGTNDEYVDADDRRIGRAFRLSLLGFLIIALGVGVGWFFLRAPKPVPVPVAETPLTGPLTTPALSAVDAPRVRFTDITRAAGIDFVHTNGAYGDRLLPETMGGGVAFFDYDNDGDPDLLFVNSDYWPDHRPADAQTATAALYRNDGMGRFENISASAGLDIELYGMGVAAGDFDGDGYTDLYITALGENRMLRNDHGRFVDVTKLAGVAGEAEDWSTGAAFFDYDNDGDLDLFVANYVRWSREIDFAIDFRLTGIGRAYGPPTTFQGTQPRLFRNNGDATFTDVSQQSGIAVRHADTGVPIAKGLGVAPVDIDGDGHMDILLSNDTVRNFLYHNRGDGSFEETGARIGVAFDRNGAATGAMGVDAAYFRNDRDLGFAIGNFANEMTSFYVAQGDPLQYADEAIGTGVGPVTRLALTFGLFFFDFDLDGRLDLFQVNGHVENEINTVQKSQRYEQPAQLLWNCGEDCPRGFLDVSQSSGDLAKPLVGRGAAYADIDGDGDLDVVLTQTGRAPRLLRNDQDTGHHWLRIKLIGGGKNRGAIGAWVELTAGGVTQRRQVMPTRSYLSQVELPITFGLGNATKIDSLTILWPDGSRQVKKNVPTGTLLTITK